MTDGRFVQLFTLCVMSLVTCHAESQQLGKERRETVECGGNFYGEYGIIKSPNYPGNYANDLECNYSISVSHEKKLQLEFSDFATESDYDMVSVYDEYDILLGTYSDTYIPGLMSSSGPSMTVSFTTDSSVVNRGFIARYWATEMLLSTPATLSPPLPLTQYCDTMVHTADIGVITSPNYPDDYPNDQDCYYRITIRDYDKVIELRADEFSTEESSDYLYIYDGSSTSASPIASYSGYAQGFLVSSSGKSMTLHFHSDGSMTRKGFRIRYTAMYRDDVWDSSYNYADSDTGDNNHSPGTSMAGFIIACCVGVIVITIGIIAGCVTYRKQTRPPHGCTTSI
ncbi:procollagen C-endopeptidase enhancer 2-like [Saccoglossus kowalevskii]|uniref:CUB and sushi domain-containing protein 1-like n=1 Tax=Saccoglossus kowalevskii TaxID=10224 RepID=A0ABM0LV17_SACKO|nr:PREDICTED: CUB and sushi domain-containing protein 1-like [Saccoglossus kowalevskii]